MSNAATFGARLAALREAAGWTRYRLAKQAGISAIQVTRIEEASQQPTWATVCKLADALGVAVSAFREDGQE